MAKTQENEYVVKIKRTSSQLGELLQANKFEESFEVANQLNNLLKSGELDEMTGKEIKELGIDVIQAELKKYWWANGEKRKYEGVLRGRGKKFSEVAG